MTNPDPMTFMYAAVESVRKEDVGEIEMEWVEETGIDTLTRLTIIVRKETRPLMAGPTTPPED